MSIFTSSILFGAIIATVLATHYKRDVQIKSSEYTYDVQAGRTCYCQCPCDGGTGDVDVRRLKRASKYDKPTENLCYCQCSCDKVDAGLVDSYIIEDVESSSVEGSIGNTNTGSSTGSNTGSSGTGGVQNTVPIKNTLNEYNTLYLDISAKGNEVWAVFCNNTVVRGQTSPSGEFQSWKAVPLIGIPAGQKVISLGASPDGNSYALTDAYDNNVFGYNAGTTTWRSNQDGSGGYSTVDQVSSCGKTCTIGINRNKDAFWGLNWGMGALKLKGNWAAIGTDASRWLVDTSGRVKQCVVSEALVATYNTSWSTWCPGNIWEVMCKRGAVTVEAQNKDRAVMTTKTGQMFIWDGKSWKLVPFDGKVTRASVTDNWVFFLNQEGNAFFANV